MCRTETQARRVADWTSEVVRLLEQYTADNHFDQIEIQGVRVIITQGNDTYIDDANEVAATSDYIKTVLNSGPLESLNPHTQAKITDIAVGRLRREQRIREQNEAAERMQRRAAGQ